MTIGNKKIVLKKFETIMREKASQRSSIFTYYSGSSIRNSLYDDYSDKVRRKLFECTSAVNSQGFQWKEYNGKREFVFMFNGISHNLCYVLDEHSIMHIFLDGQSVFTEKYDGCDSQKGLDLFAEIWLLQYFQKRPFLGMWPNITDTTRYEQK